MMSSPCKNWDGKHKSLSESRVFKNWILDFLIHDSHLMICASRPNFYKANSSLSEIFLHVSLNDLWLPSQFLQHNLIIKWNTLHMLRSMICGSRLNFFHQNMIIKWAALVWFLSWCRWLIRRMELRDQDQQRKTCVADSSSTSAGDPLLIRVEPLKYRIF